MADKYSIDCNDFIEDCIIIEFDRLMDQRRWREAKSTFLMSEVNISLFKVHMTWQIRCIKSEHKLPDRVQSKVCVLK
jgi:hypothetical protein